MADVKISELPAVTTINAGTDVLPLVSLDGGSTLTTYKSTAQQTMNAALAAPGPIGAGTANTGAFTTLSASSTVSGTGFSNYLASPPAIGGTAPAAGSFTNVSASGTVSGVGFSSYLASPPAIGGTAAAAGSFTNLSASGTVSGTGITNLLASPPAIGGTAAAAGSFTTLSASSTVSGTGFSDYLASPPAIGGTAAAAGSFTTLSGSTSVTSPIVKASSSAGGVLQSNSATQCMQWGAGGGANVTISGGLTASGTVSGTGFSDYLASPPAIGGTAAAAGSFTTLNASSSVTLSGGTANGVVYLDGSKVATSGSAMVFDGVNFGLGVTPSAWIGAWTALQVGQSAAFTSGGASDARLSCNAYLNGSVQRIYINTGAATSYEQANGAHFWFNAPSGNQNDPIPFTQTMELDANGNLLVGTPTSPSGSQVSGNAIVNGVVSTAGYTVATLPTGMPTGSRAYVTDALTPVVLTTVAGGGAVVVPVFYDGTNWIVG